MLLCTLNLYVRPETCVTRIASPGGVPPPPPPEAGPGPGAIFIACEDQPAVLDSVMLPDPFDVPSSTETPSRYSEMFVFGGRPPLVTVTVAEDVLGLKVHSTSGVVRSSAVHAESRIVPVSADIERFVSEKPSLPSVAPDDATESDPNLRVNVLASIVVDAPCVLRIVTEPSAQRLSVTIAV